MPESSMDSTAASGSNRAPIRYHGRANGFVTDSQLRCYLTEGETHGVEACRLTSYLL